jgi:hypothetical protein
MHSPASCAGAIINIEPVAEAPETKGAAHWGHEQGSLPTGLRKGLQGLNTSPETHAAFIVRPMKYTNSPQSASRPCPWAP